MIIEGVKLDSRDLAAKLRSQVLDFGVFEKSLRMFIVEGFEAGVDVLELREGRILEMRVCGGVVSNGCSASSKLQPRSPNVGMKRS